MLWNPKLYEREEKKYLSVFWLIWHQKKYEHEYVWFWAVCFAVGDLLWMGRIVDKGGVFSCKSGCGNHL